MTVLMAILANYCQSDSKGVKLMDTSLVYKKDQAQSFQFVHNTYVLSLVTFLVDGSILLDIL
jgi:hypothetical protein